MHIRAIIVSIKFILIMFYISLLILGMLAVLAKGQLPDGFDYLYNIDSTIILQPRYAISKNFVG